VEQKKPPSPREAIGIGAICAAIGVYFILVSLGVLPIPGGEKNLHGPLWILFCVGLVFLLGGLGVLAPAAATGEVRNDGELPAGSPQWLRVAQYLLGLALFASFALIGTWIAIGGGTRSFTIGGGFFETSGGGEIVGRVAFGLGAVIVWLCLLGFAVKGARKLLRRP
jgi:hypothetical protein